MKHAVLGFKVLKTKFKIEGIKIKPAYLCSFSLSSTLSNHWRRILSSWFLWLSPPLLVPYKFLGFSLGWSASSYFPPSPWFILSNPSVSAYILLRLYPHHRHLCSQSMATFPMLVYHPLAHLPKSEILVSWWFLFLPYLSHPINDKPYQYCLLNISRIHHSSIYCYLLHGLLQQSLKWFPCHMASK